MATAMFHKSIATIQLNSSGNEWSTCKKLGKYPLKIISKAFVVDVGGSFIYGQSKLHGVHALSSQSPLMDLVSSFSQNTNDYKNNTSGYVLFVSFVLVGSALILIRHGDSLWNENNLFTGCVDVPLTKKGIEEAVEACRRISNIPVDMIYTSLLIRLQMTAMLVMTNTAIKRSIQNNVPIIIRKESDRAKEWSQVFSEETKRQSIPVITAWELNERMYIKFHFSLVFLALLFSWLSLILKQAFLLFKYGELQGHNKLETAEKYGKEKVHEWRRSCNSPPANGESLKMCSQRAVAYFREHVTSLELSTGIPLLYIHKEGEFLRRGSPVGSKEAGVYAYSKKMQLNRSLYFATCRVLPFTGRHWMHCFSNTCRKETTNRRVVVGFLAMYRALADLYANCFHNFLVVAFSGLVLRWRPTVSSLEHHRRHYSGFQPHPIRELGLLGSRYYYCFKSIVASTTGGNDRLKTYCIKRGKPDSSNDDLFLFKIVRHTRLSGLYLYRTRVSLC
ncbi:hypothetical protein PVK06_005807 [Gossypium arboreum]|uniref:phosphoglycerate mutase (2,3-diphosphoglycerate-dependent) n=1 Tax=Gossypium arboreum TaxID=29729 RepID=A0ABR0QWX6_GOSAR|nr:hypothetical protein PVK06_005807 [Gossypium arboreum]